MAINLLTRPNSVNGVAKTSWLASRNPIVYRMRRYDHAVNQVNNSGGFAQLQVNGTDLTAYYQVGNTVVFNLSGVAYTGTVSASSFSGGNTLVTTSVAYSINVAGEISNYSKRTDWKIQVEVFNSAGVSLTEGLVKFDYYADKQLAAFVDVGEIVRQFVKAEWENIVTTNAVEADTSLGFYIKYQEYYDGALQGAVVNDSANVFFAVHSAMQIYFNEERYQHGGNMQDFVPFDASRKFLVRNSRLKMWRGYPFTISFIWPGSLSSISRRVQEFNSQGIKIADTITALAATTNKVHRMGVGALNVATKRLLVELISVAGGFYVQSFYGSYVGWANLATSTQDWLFGTGGASYNFASKILRSGIITPTIPTATDINVTVVVSTGQFDNLLVTLGQSGGGSTQVVNFGTRTAGTHGIAVTTTAAFDIIDITATCSTAIKTNELDKVEIANVSGTVPISLTNNTFVTNLTPWANQGAVGPNDWVWAAGDVASFTTSPGGQTSKYLVQAVSGIVGGDILSGTVDVDSGHDGNTEVVLYDSGSSTYQVLQAVAVLGASAMATYAWAGTAAFTPTHFGFRCTRNSGTSPSGVTVSGITLNKALTVTYAIPDNEFSAIATYWTQINNAFIWTQGSNKVQLIMPDEGFAVYFVATGLSEIAQITGLLIPTATDIEWSASISFVNTGDVRVTAKFYNGAILQHTFIHDVSSAGGNGQNISDSFTSGATLTRIDLTIEALTGTNFSAQIDSIEVFQSGAVTDPLEVIVEDTPYWTSPLYLFWKNSAGGDTYWMFERNMEKSKRLDNGKKATRLTLFADSIEDGDWEMIDEINSSKESYQNAIPELSSAVNKTHTQIDQQLYILESDGTKTGVIVSPRSAKTDTNRERFAIEVEIELPSQL